MDPRGHDAHEADLDVGFLVDRLMADEEERYRPSPAETLQQFLRRRRRALEGELSRTLNQALDGYALVMNVLAEDPKRDLTPYLVNTSSLSELDPDAPIILHEVFGWSDEVMATFYEAANEIYRKGHHEDTIDALTFVTSMSPHVAEYWTALAIAHEAAGHKDQAADTHRLAVFVDPSSSAAVSAALAFYRQQGWNEEADALSQRGTGE